MAVVESTRVELIEQVADLIELSLSLTVEQKDWLQDRLPSLSGDQLEKLVDIFESENERKNDLLKNFFEKHPELYDRYNRDTRDTVSSAYRDIERQELVNEETIMNDLLQELNLT
jgi:hypothetical protein